MTTNFKKLSKNVICILAVLLTQTICSVEILNSKDFSDMDNTLKLMIPKEEINKRIQETARTLEKDYEGKEITFLMVLKGSLCFTSDLIRELKHPCSVETIRASSYGQRGTERGEITIHTLGNLDLDGKDIIIIDDICDSGQTLYKLKEHLSSKYNPSSLKTLVLLTKSVGKIDEHIPPDYSLFDIENKFVVGYGLDYKEYFRGLPAIYIFGEK